MIKIMVNGQEYETDKCTVTQLLEELKIAPGRVAVEVNLAVVRKADLEAHPLHDGDKVEIVNFVGGG